MRDDRAESGDYRADPNHCGYADTGSRFRTGMIRRRIPGPGVRQWTTTVIDRWSMTAISEGGGRGRPFEAAE